ncbi:MAG TPA: GNAT family N-acetyltransferase [Nocardioidaceae bacterium]|nr:GNAT family N-acetyltransferase [Nocardioidaceae bacterium]
MTEVRVRTATTLDAAELVDSMAALFAEDAGERDSTMSVDYPRLFGVDGFTELVALPDKLVLVAEADGQVIGHLTGRVDEPSPIRLVAVATLASMYVRPAHRGEGVGARLVEMFRGWAREQGADRLAVTAYASNDGAVRFYRRQGFEPMSTVLEATL